MKQLNVIFDILGEENNVQRMIKSHINNTTLVKILPHI